MTCTLNHDDPEVIPACLCRACNPELNEAWKAAVVRDGVAVDPIDAQQRALREAQEATRNAKRREALEKHLDAHKFERWNAKDKVWERDEDKIAAHHAQLDAEMQHTSKDDVKSLDCALKSTNESHNPDILNATGSGNEAGI